MSNQNKREMMVFTTILVVVFSCSSFWFLVDDIFIKSTLLAFWVISGFILIIFAIGCIMGKIQHWIEHG